MRCRLARTLAVERIAPPLQPDRRRERFMRQQGNACDFDIESIQRKYRIAPRGGCEQCAQETVLIGLADQRLAMPVVVSTHG